MEPGQTRQLEILRQHTRSTARVRTRPVASPALLAIHKATGATLHAIELPATPTATPMTYMADGRQHTVVVYGSGADAGW
ncbi:MAG: hypothetical protein FJ207_03200 [Gemmatimonadetes bacterium]|nr:hypothetical protein [Gemmatimonadota bacterium]